MAFLESSSYDRERFSPLDLEPGEIYFKEYAVFHYPSLAPESEAIKRKQKGKLKVCSKSVVFDPKEMKHPMLKFPLKDVQKVDHWSGGLFSKIDVPGKNFYIRTEQVVKIKEKNVIGPYVSVKGSSEHIFTLLYATTENCLSQIGQLQRAATLQPTEQAAMINAIVLSKQLRIKFDASCLEDFHEDVLIESQADRITPLVTTPGRVVLTTARLYFQAFNTKDPMALLKLQLRYIRQVVKRRFLLRHVGLEILCREKASVPHLYLTLKSQPDRDRFYQRLLEHPGVALEDTGQDNNILKWQNGHISNYDYLLYLNSIADRSYNDLTQYPVMPWVIADYASLHLDLTNEATFRDLSKPIGALNKDRLTKLKKRYIEMPEPRFLYGSHYSTPGYVLFYLSRIAPEYSLCLHNGRFDQPDRMFNSISETWINSLTGASDFKELIPEFYKGSGHFLLNNAGLNFGVRQNGRNVGDVELPPWADGEPPGWVFIIDCSHHRLKHVLATIHQGINNEYDTHTEVNDERDFIQKMHDALESEYVSMHLHHWIDLIFGYKQRGRAAEEADNVFYYLTYEGAVDMENITDQNEKASLEVQIMEFGQTPKQLFTKPHPQRFCAMSFPSPFFLPLPCLDVNLNYESTHTTPSEVDNCDLSSAQRVFHELDLAACHSHHKDAVTDVHLTEDGKFIFSASKDSYFKMYATDEQSQVRSINLCSMPLSKCLPVSDNKMVIVGSWDNNIYFYSIEYGRILDILPAHDDAVSSLLVSGNKLITSSWDSTVKVWQSWQLMNTKNFTQAEFLGSLDHDSSVYCMTADASCNLLATGTKDGLVHLWDLHSFYAQRQYPCHNGQVNALLISPDKKRLITAGEDCFFKIFDIDSGIELCKQEMQKIRCMDFADGLIVAGTASGSLIVWDMAKGMKIHTMPAHQGAVTAIHVLGKTIVTGGEDCLVKLWKPVS